MRDPFVIGVGGFTSNVGKTTLMCELLRAFPGWEAIKTTRGHYRSCGKTAETCCVSHLLSEEPIVRSGREQTYEADKDTGRYWDAGAANVHWLIGTDNQIERGIKEALARVRSAGVLIEGNSFSEFVHTDYLVLVRRADSENVKKSARKILNRVSAIYISAAPAEQVELAVSGRRSLAASESDAEVFTPANLPLLISKLRTATSVLV
jgi:molybdopterin-guanine dinucleotide biosynthesis protein